MSETVEIDAGELRQLQAAYNLQNKLFNNKESKAFYEKAIKANPEFKDKYQTVEDVADPVVTPLKAQIKALEERLQKRDDKEFDDHMKSTFKDLQKHRGYTEEGIEQIKKIMVDKNIADAEAAADHWEKKNPAKSLESSYSGNSWNFTENADKAGDDANWFNTNPDTMIERIALDEFSKRK